MVNYELTNTTLLGDIDPLGSADLLHSQGDIHSAAAAYRAAILADPLRANSHFNLGVLLKSQGDMDGATRMLKNGKRGDTSGVSKR